MNFEQTLDLTLLNGYLDSLGVDVVNKMLTMYEQQTALYLDDIARVLEQGTDEEWHESCHKMKSAAASAGFLAVHKLLVVMEKGLGDSHLKNKQLLVLQDANQDGIYQFKQWLAQ